MTIPFVDLRAQYERYRDELDAAMANVMAETAFISGKHAAAFEQAFAKYAQRDHAIACANGTDSLEVLLDCLGLEAGDEVIVPALSWISTSEVVGTRGAKPVFVDIDASYTLDPAALEAAITERTVGVIPVHLYGRPANMPAIMAVAETHELWVLEDCAQAHGAEWNGQRIATFGDCASFSFYPGKNLGAYGDAGGMVTNDDAIARVARMICNHGQPQKHQHMMEGRNSRMDGLQAAVLNVKLQYIETWTEERRQVANWYRELLPGSGVELPVEDGNHRVVYHLFVVQCDNRNGLRDHLKAHGISTGIHYPTPLPLMPCYAAFGLSAADFPVAARACDRMLSLPIYPEMTRDMVAHVAEHIRSFHAG